MCYKLKPTIKQWARKNALVPGYADIYDAEVPDSLSGFTHPLLPVLTNNNPDIMQAMQWGLLPPWAGDKAIQKKTLNAKIETLNEKPSFKPVLHKRCLVIVGGFYEWQWLDPKGKKKQQYLITLPGEEVMVLGGLFNVWTNKQSGEIIPSFTIVTTEANPLMAEIHNTKKRMPLILSEESADNWLEGKDVNDFKFCNPELTTLKFDDPIKEAIPKSPSLFD